MLGGPLPVTNLPAVVLPPLPQTAEPCSLSGSVPGYGGGYDTHLLTPPALLAAQLRRASDGGANLHHYGDLAYRQVLGFQSQPGSQDGLTVLEPVSDLDMTLCVCRGLTLEEKMTPGVDLKRNRIRMRLTGFELFKLNPFNCVAIDTWLRGVARSAIRWLCRLQPAKSLRSCNGDWLKPTSVALGNRVCRQQPMPFPLYVIVSYYRS